VSNEIHLVAQAKTHEGISRAELVTVLALPRMDELPLHVILGRNLVEVLLDENYILRNLLGAPSEPGGARDHAAVYRRADGEVVLEYFHQRDGRFSGTGSRDDGKCESRKLGGLNHGAWMERFHFKAPI
jgi:hypothetical protein